MGDDVCVPTTSSSRDEVKLAFDETILERLVALNAERAAKEARGVVRWLRPEFQYPAEPAAPNQAELPDDGDRAHLGHAQSQGERYGAIR
ncbi:MAG: hypothetical protein EPN74_11755 [Rhodanobacter sp.]|nr:MAG: hypothetical protein EPN74_11755 [Rhodanobacter sp.]